VEDGAELVGKDEESDDPEASIVVEALKVAVEGGSGGKTLGFPKVEEDDQFGRIVALGVKLDASGLKVEALLLSPEVDGAVLFSGKNSPSPESSAIAFVGSPSWWRSASMRPSRIALATPTPLITATRERLYRFASTML
jgi:hypothetical protein